MVFYQVDPETGEAMDELYYQRKELAKHRAAWGGVCEECRQTFPCKARKALNDAVNAQQSARRTQIFGERVRRPYKRSDVPTTVVLSCVYTLGFTAFDVLSETFPAKIVLAAFMRDMSRGLMECGTTETKPWLTPAGKQWLASYSDSARRGRRVNGQGDLKPPPYRPEVL